MAARPRTPRGTGTVGASLGGTLGGVDVGGGLADQLRREIVRPDRTGAAGRQGLDEPGPVILESTTTGNTTDAGVNYLPGIPILGSVAWATVSATVTNFVPADVDLPADPLLASFMAEYVNKVTNRVGSFIVGPIDPGWLAGANTTGMTFDSSGHGYAEQTSVIENPTPGTLSHIRVNLDVFAPGDYGGTFDCTFRYQTIVAPDPT